MPGAQVLEDLDVAAATYAGRAAVVGPAERGELRDALVRRCLPFAGRIAHRYRGRGESLEDLEQVARLGLVKAVDRYDPRRGSFTAYAVITMSGEIKRHFRDKAWGVHVPRRVQDLSLEVGRASRTLTGLLSRTPTTAELAERLDVSSEAVLDAIGSAAGYAPSSLNVSGPGDGATQLGDRLGAVDRDLESVDDRLTIAELLSRLPVRERRMLAMRFYGNRTQVEIAAELGVSQMHVSRLLARALTWLREAMLSDGPPPWEHGETGAAVEVSADRSGGLVTVRVRGEVDRDTVGPLRRGLAEALRGDGTEAVVVELRCVPLLDATGVAALLDAASAASAAGVGLHLTGAQPYVARILAVAGLAGLLAHH
ncbi:SigB/SigF/SigG family RNA polymerase sigma factor [Micromonosporaceae bacterium Da 78-11]